MRAIALVLDLCFVVAAFGVRTFVQWRRTGDTGWRLGRPRSRAELAARASLLLAAALLVGALVAADTEVSNEGVTSIMGGVLAVVAVVAVLVAQLHMGDSWRIGVDPAEQTQLVRTGLYEQMRNPIYTGMVLFAVGQALLVPGPWSVAAVMATVVGVEIQVRRVEEPYLRATHRLAYEQWAAQVGRFVPAVGRSRRRRQDGSATIGQQTSVRSSSM